MVLLFLVIIGVAVFCFTQGYILLGVICLIGFSGKIGFIALAVTSLALIVKGHWIIGALPLLLIGVNLVFLDKKKRTEIIEE